MKHYITQLNQQNKMSKNFEIKNQNINGSKDKFVPNTNYSRTTHSGMDLYIGVNGKVKTKFFGK
jgi:hypothetical protein